MAKLSLRPPSCNLPLSRAVLPLPQPSRPHPTLTPCVPPPPPPPPPPACHPTPPHPRFINLELYPLLLRRAKGVDVAALYKYIEKHDVNKPYDWTKVK